MIAGSQSNLETGPFFKVLHLALHSGTHRKRGLHVHGHVGQHGDGHHGRLRGYNPHHFVGKDAPWPPLLLSVSERFLRGGFFMIFWVN